MTSGLPHICTAVGCFSLAHVVRSVMFVGSAMFAFAVLSVLNNVSAARGACRRERERLDAEVTAFRQFGRRVDAMEPSLPALARTDGGRIVDAAAPPSEGDDLAAVRDAYRETVMGVDHYEDEYADSLRDSLRQEYSPDVARTVMDGPGLTPDLQRALVSGAHGAADHRATVRAAVERELEALDDAGSRLESIREGLERLRSKPRIEGFGSLADRWRRLGALEADCEDVLRGRQDALGDDVELRRYVYDDLDVDFPVLADVAAMLESLRAERAEVRWMLARTA